MRQPRLLLFAAVLAALASLPLFAAEPARPAPPRFSAGYMDRSADPRADFARYAFGTWQKANPVPPDKARWSSFNELEQYNQLALKGILEAAAARTAKPGSVEQKVGDFFKSAMDTAAVDAAVSIADLKKSPTFCSTEPGFAVRAAAASRMPLSASWLYCSSSLKLLQRALSGGTGFIFCQAPKA